MIKISKKITIVAIIFILIVLWFSFSGSSLKSYSMSFTATIGEPIISQTVLIFSDKNIDFFEKSSEFEQFIQSSNTTLLVAALDQLDLEATIYTFDETKLYTDYGIGEELIVKGSNQYITIYAIPEVRNSNTQYLSNSFDPIEKSADKAGYVINNERKGLLQLKNTNEGLSVPFNFLFTIEHVHYVRKDRAKAPFAKIN